MTGRHAEGAGPSVGTGPYVGTMELRWSDQDLYGHVNNVRLLTLTEEARVRAAHAWGDGDVGAGTQRVVRAMTTEYEAPVQYGPELTVKVWVARIGGTSYTLRHELWQEGRRALVCDAVMVHLDAQTGRPEPISDERRALLERRMAAED